MLNDGGKAMVGKSDQEEEGAGEKKSATLGTRIEKLQRLEMQHIRRPGRCSFYTTA